MMGYATNYNMTVRHVKDEEEYKALLDTLDSYGIIRYALDSGDLCGNEAYFSSYDSVKWYEHEEDMKEISRLFPDMVFQLTGDGEDTGDIWEKYFKNGECEECRAVITIPKPTKIKWE